MRRKPSWGRIAWACGANLGLNFLVVRQQLCDLFSGSIYVPDVVERRERYDQSFCGAL
jgi:hypothetical protein